MRKARLALVIVIATASAAHAASQPSVRLDLPPGYLAAKPPAAPQKASATQGDCISHCTTFDDGFAWAEARGFKTEEHCRGRTRAFVEGCMIYVTERRRQNR
jgi:hypothetical protein